MEQQGIISKLDRNTATELNTFIIVKKPIGDFRICLDPTYLNKYVVRPVCNSNTLDEISFELQNAKHFSVFDATKGFFHLPLNDKSKLRTDMLTLNGVCVSNVLAMGLSSANDLFESALWELLEGLAGVGNIANDILVFVATQEEHVSNVISILERCLEVNLKLSTEKVKLNCNEVPFFRQCVTASGIKPDPAKVDAIQSWPILTNLTELMSFLGSVNYLSRFIPEVSAL